MKKSIIMMFGLFAVAIGIYVYAADHIDAPGVASTNNDITDYYAFASPANNDNMVLVANVQGLLSPSATADASYADGTLIEFNIDNDGDNIEDLVIQCLFDGGVMTVYGPYTPITTGTNTTIKGDAVAAGSVVVTSYGSTPEVGAGTGGMKFFAGPRDDPFFFDFGQFGQILGGMATSFNDPGTDTFAGTNVLSAVVELPKSMLGAASVNTWVETKTRQ